MMFEPPKSVRQIGEPSKNPRIYVEDYVVTFARQLAKQAGEKEVAGVLLGKTCMKQREKYIKISGMVTIDGMNELSGHTFTHQMWTDIYTQIKEHFLDVEIVGWYYAKSEMPLVYSEHLQKIHQQNFAGGDKLLYIYEEGEKEDAFFVPEKEEMVRHCGYFIYYEKNPQMQEYMLLKKPHVPEEVPDGAIQNMRTLLEKKQEEKQAKRHHGLGTAVAVLAVILCVAAMGNQAFLQNQVANLKNKLSQKDPGIQKAKVETLSSNVKPITKSAISVKVVTEPGVAASKQKKPAQSKSQPKKTPMPTPAKKKVVSQNNKFYIVKEGDTLSQIAQKIYSNIAYASKIKALNGMKSADDLKIGQKLKLPNK